MNESKLVNFIENSVECFIELSLFKVIHTLLDNQQVMYYPYLDFRFNEEFTKTFPDFENVDFVSVFIDKAFDIVKLMEQFNDVLMGEYMGIKVFYKKS